jgi:hypothetical protein
MEADPTLPASTTIDRWRDDHAPFAAALARAKTQAAALIVAEAKAILDDVDVDSKFGSARISKAREQAAFRKWLAGVKAPDTYAPASKLQVDAKIQLLSLTAFADLSAPPPVAGDAGTDEERGVLGHCATPDAVDEDSSS